MQKKITEHGGKAYQRDDYEDRALDYRIWRYGFPRKQYVYDVDHIEMRAKNGKLVPVAVFELTRTDSSHVGAGYLKAILKRYKERDSQAEFIKWVAKKLGCHAYIVLFNKNLTRFWVYDLTEETIWKIMNQYHYKKWVMGL